MTSLFQSPGGLFEALRSEAQRKAIFAKLRQNVSSSRPTVSGRAFTISGSNRTRISVNAPPKTKMSDMARPGSDLRKLVASAVKSSRKAPMNLTWMEKMGKKVSLKGSSAKATYSPGKRLTPGIISNSGRGASSVSVNVFSRSK